jgi:hypothetical protein
MATGGGRQGLVSRVDDERKNEDGSTSRAADSRPVLHGFSSQLPTYCTEIGACFALALAQGTRQLRG